jgi:hypothetical protein
MPELDHRSNGGSDDGERELVVGLIAAPGPATDLARSLLAELPGRLAKQLPGVRWTVRLKSDRLVEPPVDPGGLIQAAREKLLDEGWHLAVCITDLPLTTSRRPVVAYSSPTHGVAVLSLPALGAVDVRRRALREVVRLLSALLTQYGADEDGDVDERKRRSRTAQRMAQLGSHIEKDHQGVWLVAIVVTGNFRLLLGMLRANRPWRAVVRLSSAVVAALGIAVLSLVNGFIWQIGDGGGLLRLGGLAIASIVALVLTLILGGKLPEQVPRVTDRSARPGVREQVVLFNLVTVITVVIGVVALYLILFALTILVSFLLLPPEQVARQLGHPVSVATLMAIAWLVASLATVGGALGAGLQRSRRIREVAYTYRPDRQSSRRD